MNTLPPIQFIESVESTNDLALRAGSRGGVHGACWAADEQTQGRGRRDLGGARRLWFSPPGVNLYLSVLLKPDLSPSKAAGLTLAAASGVCGALRALTGVDIWVKWPNDLYVGDKKLGGLLTEASTDRGVLSAVVVGLGINVNVSEEQVPDELADIMTSLRIAAGQSFDRLQLLPAIRSAVVASVADYIQGGFGAFIDDLRELDRTRGRRVEIRVDGEWVEGTARGISEDGRLRVETAGGVRVLQAGEVRF